MEYSVEQIDPNLAQILCREITADLPEYFGLPEVNEHYIQGMLTRTSFAIKIDQNYSGLLTLEFPYPQNANIYWMGIKEAYQDQGLGKALVRAASYFAANQGTHSLTVETLSPQEANENYLNTYRFYEKCGFRPLFNLKPEGYKYSMVYMIFNFS